MMDVLPPNPPAQVQQMVYGIPNQQKTWFIINFELPKQNPIHGKRAVIATLAAIAVNGKGVAMPGQDFKIIENDGLYYETEVLSPMSKENIEKRFWACPDFEVKIKE